MHTLTSAHQQQLCVHLSHQQLCTHLRRAGPVFLVEYFGSFQEQRKHFGGILHHLSTGLEPEGRWACGRRLQLLHRPTPPAPYQSRLAPPVPYSPLLCGSALLLCGSALLLCGSALLLYGSALLLYAATLLLPVVVTSTGGCKSADA